MAFILPAVLHWHVWSCKKPQEFSPSTTDKCLQGFSHSNQFQMGYERILPASNTAYIVNQRWWTLQNFSQAAEVSSKKTAHISLACYNERWCQTKLPMLNHIIWKIININGEANKCKFEMRQSLSINVHEKYNRLNFSQDQEYKKMDFLLKNRF